MKKYDELVKKLGLQAFKEEMDLSLADAVMDKHDGSLISSFSTANGLRLKSKTSLSSEQAVAALKLLESEKYADLHQFVAVMEYNNYTVNMEYEAPTNRIVLKQQDESLTVLNVRSRVDGSYMNYSVLEALMKEYGCGDSLVRNIASNIQDYQAFVDSVDGMTGIEGFVVMLPDGTWFKLKTAWYCNLHGLKDNVNSTKRLFECVVSEASDDLRAQFHDDAYILNKISEMELIVRNISGEFNENVYTFYHENKHLDRKSYAIKGQAELPKLYFNMAMNLYLEKAIDVKEWMIKHYKDFDIKDDNAEAVE